MIADIDDVARGHGIDRNLTLNNVSQLLNCPQLMKQFTLDHFLKIQYLSKIWSKIIGQTL
jgi:hypothetical protein